MRAGEAGSPRGSGQGGQVHPGSECAKRGAGLPRVRAARPGLPGGPSASRGGRVYPGVRVREGEARSTRGSGQGRPGRPGPGPPGVRAGRPGLPRGPGREARSTRGSGQGRPGPPGGPSAGRGGQVYPGVRAGEAARREARVYPECGQGRPGPGPPGVRAGRPGLPRGPSARREVRSTPGSERGCLRRGYQVYPLTRRRLRGEKKKETEKEGGEKKTRARAGPLRRTTRGHLLPARPLPPGGRTPPGEEGGGGPERPPPRARERPRPASPTGPPGDGRGRGRETKACVEG